MGLTVGQKALLNISVIGAGLIGTAAIVKAITPTPLCGEGLKTEIINGEPSCIDAPLLDELFGRKIVWDAEQEMWVYVPAIADDVPPEVTINGVTFEVIDKQVVNVTWTHNFINNSFTADMLNTDCTPIWDEAFKYYVNDEMSFEQIWAVQEYLSKYLFTGA